VKLIWGWVAQRWGNSSQKRSRLGGHVDDSVAPGDDANDEGCKVTERVASARRDQHAGDVGQAVRMDCDVQRPETGVAAKIKKGG